MKELDYGQALVFLEKAVAEKGPDYVYLRKDYYSEDTGGCVYFDGGAPSCIVGHVLSYMGFDSAPEGRTASQALRTKAIKADQRTQDLLDSVQESQDSGVPWGESVLRAQGFEDG